MNKYYTEGFRDKLDALRKEKRKEDRSRRAVDRQNYKAQFSKMKRDIDKIAHDTSISDNKRIPDSTYQESHGVFNRLYLI